MNFDLMNIIPANQTWKPQKVLLYGPQGLGKTTFGATFESPILIRTEDGAGAIDVPTFPEMVTDFDQIEAIVNSLHGEHPYKTLLVDSLDWLEPIVHNKTCQVHNQNTIESFGYGKGYAEADAFWRYLMGMFDSLRLNKGMNIVLIAHSEVKNYSAPDTEPYDRYQIKLHKRAFALWQEWVDMVLFCRYRTIIERTETGFNQEKTRGTGSGERLIHTEERPAYLAKNRWALPPEIYIGQDKTWGGFHKALNEATNGRYEIPNNNNGAK